MAKAVMQQETGGAQLAFVSVIIPHFNDLPSLRCCLAGLDGQTIGRDRFEVIVADNNSQCGLHAVRAAAPDCQVIHAPVQGAGPARNAAAAICRGTILAFIDSDCRPDPQWIEHGIAALERFDFAGGHVCNIPDDPAAITDVEAWELEFGFDFERYIRGGYTGSGNMWVWRDVFHAVGGFRAGVSEDMDWSFRARRAGYRLGYAPLAIVSHYARRDWAALQARWVRVIREHYLLTSERPFGRLRWAAWTAAMPASIVPHLWRVACSTRLPTPALKMAATRILIRHRLWRTWVMCRMAASTASRALAPASA